ncbi:Disease resistance protein (CC-NBS-LRR class) family [Rhynchospora pubera]|uniref:Disease resistance protein (CC-NBS-LRR class) family n=1 Tax=Rhynchospora pubera TaxID=906938 RepID=A0AAV8D1Q1_9POAL|nr:Disease resistance protein (CC-NBS-LRR class) family [Rhynchospora pubera]
MAEFWNKAIEFLATTIGQSAVDALWQNSAVSANISKLRATLPRARLLIERSECWRFRYKPIDELLPQVKEAVYEAEIRLDEYDSEKWRVEGANWKVPGELINNFKNWVGGFPAKVLSAQDAVEHMSEELEKICNNFSIPENPNEFSRTARPITSSDHPKIYGREKELDHAKSLLGVPKSDLFIGESTSIIAKKRKLVILPIVGMGGVGKTTLAQMVYKDKNVQSYFNLKVWVCVSDQFDLERLTKEIIQCATGNECNVTNLDLLQETLKNLVKYERILLVLDDIWSKDWQRLLGPMIEASDGSAVILTTRDPEHIECTGGDMNILDFIRLEGLEENIYWDFFKVCSGLEVDSENYIQLENIGREICSRLKGFPLAAITLGGLLRKRLDEQHWINIRDSKMWELKHGEHDIMPVLQLSYQYLPSHLKKCFSFCSLYPKDHEFTSIELAKLWIMYRFIPVQESLKRMEDIALGYFHELKNSCFFHYKDNSYGIEKFVIHDLMHDVCQSITKDECYCLEDENIGKISLNIYHIYVFDMNPVAAQNLRKMFKLKKLQSLVVSPYCSFGAIKSLCHGLKSIRRLSLPCSKIKKIPENIGNLKHLQYLDISDTQIQNLPDSFCTLYNLQHLDMLGCDQVLCFPNGSNKLTGLQIFRPPLHLLPHLSCIPNLSRAMQLYNVTYHVGNDGRNTIENLKHMTRVNGFLIIRNLENVSRKEAAEEAELNKKELDKLCLYWDDTWTNQESNKIHMEVLEGLRPHSNLTVLEIHGYKGQELSPSWMGSGLPNLRRILFNGCFNCTLSQLPRSITELEIRQCGMLTSLQDCLQPNLLPKLKSIYIGGKELVSLPVESFGEFVFLEYCSIKSCLNLKCPRMMVLPPTIKRLELDKCGELDYSIPSCLQNLTSLRSLILSHCPHIVSIPAEVMKNLKSLWNLTVLYCENLESLGDEQFLESLKSCNIVRCPHLTKLQYLNGGRHRKALLSGAAVPNSSRTIPPKQQRPLIATPTTGTPAITPGPPSNQPMPSTVTMALDEPTAAAQSSPSIIPSNPYMPSIVAPPTDTPSSSNESRKRKRVRQRN